MLTSLTCGPERRKAAFRSGRFAMDTNSIQSHGLVGWWPLGVHSGHNEWDYSGFKHHTTRTSVPAQKSVLNPKWGGIPALDFDGTDDVLDAGGSPDLKITGPLTMMVSVKGNGTPDSSDEGIIGTGLSGYQFTWHTDGKIYFYLDDGSNSVGTAVSSDVWHHVVGSWDGTTNAGGFLLYIDGVEVVSGTSSRSSISGHTNFFIGRTPTTGNYYKGIMNDVRIYNRFLDSSIIRQAYHEPWRLVRPFGLL